MTDEDEAPRARTVSSGCNSPTHTGGGHQSISFFGALIGSGAALAAAVRYGFDVAKTALIERGKTRREQLRQDGQTDRARIAAGSASPAPGEFEAQGESPEGDAAAPGNAA
ncbi:hypothetical protein ACFYW8_42925 [Streptomyces sp. NPDC002742]|uniref:hypothetical protein n=1 Tax=Streptomyces sp. NPDC002742 TaxID=3364663 RepID=UPI0036BB38BF